MKLPERVQTAIEVLAPHEFRATDIAPFWYRCFLRFRPDTPPPLFDASKAAWTFLAFVIAMPMGTAISLLSWWSREFSSSIYGIGFVFVFTFFISWAIAGSVGWACTVATRKGFGREHDALGLPSWNAFDSTWRPSLAFLRERTDAERFWLYSIWEKPWFTRATVIGLTGFFVLAYFLPMKAGVFGEVVAMVSLLLCLVGLVRSAKRRPLPRGVSTWMIVNGVLVGAVSAALFWTVVIADIYQYPTGKSTLLFGMLGALAYLWDAYTYQQQKSIAQRAQNAEQERLLAEAKLEKLKAQIEPHFIFNTLAHLRRLIATDGKSAEKMAEALSDFLRANLSSMQREWTTVEEDFKLAGAYLDLARIRIGERLNPRIHAAFEAKTAEIPPLMVLTLLENAIQHAVEPNAGATAIDVSAELTSTNQLVIRVADTGAGFGANQSGGSGLGLANIRERLQSLYRGEAELKLSANSPSGVVAELRLPFKAVCAQANP